jgi:hypothetical protein
MTEESEISVEKPPMKGRTWADVFVSTTYIAAGCLFLVVAAVLAYFVFGKIPTWFFISIGGSLLFIPFLMERAKDGSDLFIVCDEPFRLTEYRVGRRTGLDIEGRGIQFVSKSGTYRTYLSALDPETMTARGSPFAEFTQLDQLRDLTTLQRVIDTLENTLKENRISSQEVGIEVEKQSISIVDWALKTIYGAIVPTEISEAFGIESKSESLAIDSQLTDLDVEVFD